MRDLKPKVTKIKLGDKEYGMLFSINLVDELQDHFDRPIAELMEILKDERNIFKNIRWLVYAFVNEWIDEENEKGAQIERLDERQVGRKINLAKMEELQSLLLEAIKNGSPIAEPDPNSQSEPSL